MSQELNYYPTGRVLQFRGAIPAVYEIASEKFITLSYDGTTLALSSTPLNREGGQIVSADNRASIPLGMQYPAIWTGTAGDKLLITAYSSYEYLSLIIIVDLNTYQYWRYRGPDFRSRPIGIHRNIIYLSSRINDQSLITGFDLTTGQTESQYRANDVYGMLGKTPNGEPLAAVLERESINGTPVIRIVNILDEDVLIEMEGDVKILSVKENGVIFTESNGDYYFVDYQAVKYRLNFIDNGPGLRDQQIKIVGSSDSGDSIWLGPMVPSDGKRIINYKLQTYRNSQTL